MHFYKLTGSFFLFICLCGTVYSQSSFLEKVLHETSEGELVVTEIIAGDKLLGQSYWYRRAGNKVKAKYFASNDPFATFRSWRRGKYEILGICGGDYLNADQSPSTGILVYSGQISSGVFNPILDGLVIVEEVGGIRVVNLEKGPITVYYNTTAGRKIGKQLDPADPTDLEELLTWSVEAKATLFQTHLLAWKNKVKPDAFTNSDFNKSKLPKRFLALVYDDLNELYFVVLDINQNLPIGKAALASTKYFIKHRKVKKMVALINLDRSDSRPMDNYFTLGPVSGLNDERILEDYRNILVFYR